MQLTLKEMPLTWVEHGGAVFPAHVITDPLTPIVARTRSGELIVALANEVWRHASWADKESDHAVVKFRLALRDDLTRLAHLCPTITDAVRQVLATDLISQRVESATKTLSAEESARQFEAAIGDVDLRMPEETVTTDNQGVRIQCDRRDGLHLVAASLLQKLKYNGTSKPTQVVRGVIACGLGLKEGMQFDATMADVPINSVEAVTRLLGFCCENVERFNEIKFYREDGTPRSVDCIVADPFGRYHDGGLLTSQANLAPEETGTAEPTCHPSAVTDKTVLDSLISGKGTLTVQINGTDQIVEIPTANFKYDGDTDRLVLTEPVTLPFPSGDLTLNGAVFMTPEQVARGAIASGLRLKETPCSHVFKSKHCGYTGEADTCDKSSVQCESFGNMHNFAGLPPRPQTDSDAALDAYSDAALDESFALPSDDVEEEQWALPCMSATPDFDVAGYESLADVLLSAYRQAAIGKGKERHACGRPFDEQPMQDLIRLHGLGFATGQASKKASEALRLPTPERQEAELLGAINYLAGAVIAIRRAAEVDEE